MSASEKPTGYVVPHTHWDREWRYPLWHNRLLLVEFMDLLLKVLDEDPEYKCFVTDGQSVLIEDYLQIRHEREDEIRRHVAAGRIHVGPWYTLPDLYPVAGECLVRNLLRGIRYADDLGGHLPIGHTSFGWGQTAQLPQIYRGFGIESVIVGKKVSDERAPESEFIWEAPDGSQVLATRLGEHARANFFMNAYIPITTGIEYLSPEYRFHWERAGSVYHEASHDAYMKDYFRTGHRDEYHPEKLISGIEKAWSGTDATAAKDCRLLLNGSDFSTPQPALSKILREANEALSDKKLVHGTLVEYFDALRACIDTKKLRTVEGELRDGPGHGCSANALATRIAIKQLNKRVENALLRRAEPLCSAMATQGCEYPSALLDIACKFMLLSHPHDSINGVTQDKTARDTVNRLEQALEIAEAAAEKASSELIGRINLERHAKDDILMVLINTLSRGVAGPIRLCIDTPQERGVWDFTVMDSDGKVCDVQHISRRETVVPVHDLNTRPWPFYVDRHDIVIDCGKVPEGGYKVLKMIPRTDFDRLGVFWPKTPRSGSNEIASLPNGLENEHLKVDVHSDGTITVTDKASGTAHRNIHWFEDTGDVGDYWVYYAPYENRTFSSLGSPARVWLEENGQLQATIGVEVKMIVPAKGERPEAGIRGESRRSTETCELVVTSRFTLRKGSKRLEVKTVVNNSAEDHRLRLMIPTDIQTDFADAAGHFCVDHRPMRPAPDREGKHFVEMRTQPQQTFVDVSDGTRGLAVVNNSLTEYELVDDERRTIALTLFRAVRNIICTEFRSASAFPKQKGGQSLGELEYEYAIYPHAGNWDKGRVYAEADEINVPLRAYQASPHEGGTMDECSSLFSIWSSELQLTAFKKCEDRSSYVVRVHNPTERKIEAKLRIAAQLKRAWLISLNEERLTEIPLVDDSSVRFTALPNKIVTMEVEV